MNIRLATLDDANTVKRLADEFSQKTLNDTSFNSAYRSIVESEARDIILVTVDDEVRGMAVINIVQKLANREARIDEVIVSQKARGQGLGKSLLTACYSWAYDKHADIIEFTSRPSRLAANSLYQKMGYSLRETNVYQQKLKEV